jgi:hypothetical protein
MESLTVTLAKLLREHPISVPYVLVCGIVVLVLGLHPW